MFKHSECFVYGIGGTKSENCILIDSKNWLENTSNMVVGYNSRGGIATTCITEVLDVNINKDSVYANTLGVGDKVLLSTVATRLYCSKTFQIPIGLDTTEYANIPVTHVMGKFEHGIISLSFFAPLADYVLLKREDPKFSNLIITTSEKTKSVYKVISTSNAISTVKEGDMVLVRDNVTTPISFFGDEYHVCTVGMIVGRFNNTDVFPAKLSKDEIEPLHSYTIMHDYQSRMAEGSTTIVKPVYDEANDEEFTSQLYSETTYKVITSCDSTFQEGDYIYMPREATDYVTYNGNRYYTSYGNRYIQLRIREDK